VLVEDALSSVATSPSIRSGASTTVSPVASWDGSADPDGGEGQDGAAFRQV
jgi:hypothetical protein